MSDSNPKPKSEYQEISAKFAAAKALMVKEDASGGNRDAIVKRKNIIGQRSFTYTHGLVVTLLLVFFYLHAVGIFLFTKGFLLTRMVLEHKSSCADSPLLNYGDSSVAKADGCWHPKTFDKAVVVVIDALRYDFTIPYSLDSDSGYSHHFHNKFTTPYEITSKNPENSILVKFLADPPTTTTALSNVLGCQQPSALATDESP